MLLGLLFLIHLVGGTATSYHLIRRIDEETEVWMTESELGAAAVHWLLMTTFWPAYWTMRLLGAPAQLMLPPPGEGT